MTTTHGDRGDERSIERIDAGLPPRVVYSDLTAKQKEIYNFQKLAALLAEHGFNCIKLADDWRGADFLAYHAQGDTTFKVQLKARLTIRRMYLGKGLHLAFPIDQVWYLIDHDALVEICSHTTSWLGSASWGDGEYSTKSPSKALRTALQPFALKG